MHTVAHTQHDETLGKPTTVGLIASRTKRSTFELKSRGGGGSVANVDDGRAERKQEHRIQQIVAEKKGGQPA